jgi:hypothetical protein
MTAPQATDAKDPSGQPIEFQTTESQPWLRLMLVMTVPVLLLLVGISLTR